MRFRRAGLIFVAGFAAIAALRLLLSDDGETTLPLHEPPRTPSLGDASKTRLDDSVVALSRRQATSSRGAGERRAEPRGQDDGFFRVVGVAHGLSTAEALGATLRLHWQRYPETQDGRDGGVPAPPLVATLSATGQFSLRVPRKSWVPFRLYEAELRTRSGLVAFVGAVPLDPWLELEVDPEVVLRATVEVDGRAAAGAAVLVMTGDAGEPTSRAVLAWGRTDGSGHAELKARFDPEAVQDVLVRVGTKEAVFEARRDLRRWLEAGRLVLRWRTARLDVRVRSPSNDPLEGALVTVWPAEGATDRPMGSRRTGADGIASFVLGPGRYAVVAHRAGRHGRVAHVDVHEGPAPPVDLVLTAVSDVDAIQGVVVDDRGVPLPGIRILALADGMREAQAAGGAVEVRTAEDGSFRLLPPSRPRTRLLVEYPGQPIHRRGYTVACGSRVRIVLSELVTVRILPRSVAAVPVRGGARLECAVFGVDRRLSWFESTRGRAVDLRLPAGRYNVYARTSDGRYFGQAFCVLAESSRRAEVDVDLLPSTRLRGRVVGTDGQRKLLVCLVRPDWPEELSLAWFSHEVRASGEFETWLPDLPETTLRISTLRRGVVLATRKLTASTSSLVVDLSR